MTKQELQSKLEQTEKLLSELKTKLMKKDVEEEWPKQNDKYLYIDPISEVKTYIYERDNTDESHKSTHNLFKPSDRAFVERLAKKQAFQRLLEKTAYELNGGWQRGEFEAKKTGYYIRWNQDTGDFYIGNDVWSYSPLTYFKSMKTALKAISLIGEDVLKEGFGL